MYTSIICKECGNNEYDEVSGWDSSERILICTVCGEDEILYGEGR